MRVEVKVPQLPESVAEATLVSWHKQPGDAVRRDENLIDVETDKVVLELPAPDNGVLVEIVRPNGATVASQEVIAVIDTEAKSAVAPAAKPAAAAATTASSAAAPAPVAAAPAATSATALPAARKLLAETGVDPATVEGTGRGGRITKGDVLAATEAKAAPAAPAAARPAPAAPASLPAAPGSRPEQRVPMSRLRQRVAERLVQSQSTAAILTTFNEVNMQPVIDLRNRYKDRFEKEHGVKLGFMGFFVKAAVARAEEVPGGQRLDRRHRHRLPRLFRHRHRRRQPARAGRPDPARRRPDVDRGDRDSRSPTTASAPARASSTVEELTGGTYTISNGGVFGSMLSTPIINPPQSAILGVHATKDRAVVENGQVVVRPVNYLAQSYDHRIIDGREAVLSLVAIKDALEDPARLLLGL